MDPKSSEHGLQYHLFRASGPGSELAPNRLREELYTNWEKVWRGVFGQVGQADALSPDEFFRQHLIACITDETGTMVGMHLYTFFDLSLRSHREHSYFDGITELSFARMKKMALTRIMSMEYLTVFGKWRKHESGIAMGDVVVALGQKVLTLSGYDAVVGTPRTDIGVNKVGERLGFTTIQGEIRKYDYTCCLMVCPVAAALPHPDPATRDLIDRLWNRRVDSSGFTNHVVQFPSRKVA